MTTFFLQHDEIITLTGKKRPDAQIRHLRRRGIAFEVDANNRPVIIRETLTQTTPKERAEESPKLCFPKDKRKKPCAAAKPTHTFPAASIRNTAHSGT